MLRIIMDINETPWSMMVLSLIWYDQEEWRELCIYLNFPMDYLQDKYYK